MARSDSQNFAALGAIIAGILTAALVPASVAQAPSDKIPQFASKDFGWQTNLEDWQDPPPGSGHGPIRNNNAYPFISNAEANRTGTRPTSRVTNSKIGRAHVCTPVTL